MSKVVQVLSQVLYRIAHYFIRLFGIFGAPLFPLLYERLRQREIPAPRSSLMLETATQLAWKIRNREVSLQIKPLIDLFSQAVTCYHSRNTWLACSYLPFSDGRGRRAPQAVQSYRVQSEGVKNESKGLQETGLPATVTSVHARYYFIHSIYSGTWE